MSSQVLFEESSSDEEEADLTNEEQPGKPAEKVDAPESKDDDGAGDDDVDKGDAGETNVDKTENEGEKEDAAGEDKKDDTNDGGGNEDSAPSSNRPTINDDDSDEGDEEFDDGGAVVGSAAPKKKKKKFFAEEAEEVGADPETPTPKGKAPTRPPQNATVLEADRPTAGISLHMTKLPNLLAIQPSAFEESRYREKEEEEDYKGYVHNMIRWRYKRSASGALMRDDDGNVIRESNSKLVKWSDGSFTLHVGNETFDIQTVNSSSNGFAGLNGYVYMSQKVTYADDEDEDDGAGKTCLECMGSVASRLIAKPSSLQSEAHKSLTVAVRQRTIKQARIAEYVTQEDPEKAKQERIRFTQDIGKTEAKKRPNSYRPNTSRPGMNRRYLEADDGQYETTSLRALKRRREGNDDMDYENDSDGFDDGYSREARARRRRRQKQAEEEEEEDDDDEQEMMFDEESDEDNVTRVKAKKRTQAVLDDDDDDD